MPGRARTFAFEQLVGFDVGAWNALRQRPPIPLPDLQFYGSDRDAGAIRSANANAERAGVAALTRFDCHSVSDTLRPDGPPGLVMINPPYGGRIGDKKQLFGLYASLGKTLAQRFSGWRVGLVTTDAGLARATNLPFGPPGPPVSHGGLKINLWQTKALR
jgi:putative N6-adenine-specific DNA methylase